MKTIVMLLLLSVSAFGQYTYDVKAFGGAKCDGVSDDTNAIQNTINAAAAAITVSGAGGGPIYFPPSSGFCKVTTLTYPAMNKGWLVSLFDNGLFANTIHLGTFNAYIGRSGSFGGLSGGFLYGPTASWQQTSTTPIGPLVDINGQSNIWVEGISMFTGTTASTDSVVHVHNKGASGSVYLTFKRCVIGSSVGQGSSLIVDTSSPTQSAGFGLKIEDSSLQMPLSIENFGFVSIEHSYLPRLSVANLGLPSMGDIMVDDVLSEGLKNTDFLTINQTPNQVTDITLRRVKIADSVGSYMVKNISTSNYITSVLIEQTPLGNFGNGLVDPASTNYLMSLNCIGNGCQTSIVLTPAWRALYNFEGFTSQGTVVFGSQYVKQPLTTLGPSNFH